jgi:hypothetical protein
MADVSRDGVLIVHARRSQSAFHFPQSITAMTFARTMSFMFTYLRDPIPGRQPQQVSRKDGS